MKTAMNTPLNLFFLLTGWLIFSNPLNAQEWTYTISAGGSDYSITATYDSDGPCQCNDKYSFSVFRNNYLPSNFMGSKSGASSTGSVTFAVGPGTNNNYLLSMNVEGRNQFVFNCAIDCEASGSASRKVSTRAIKSPRNVQATRSEDYIELSWTKGTDIPDRLVRYRIAKGRQDNIIATISGSSRFFRDSDVGPGESHEYYVFTYTSEWGGHTSSPIRVTGATRDRELNASTGLPKKVDLSWDDLSGITDEVTIRRNGNQIVKLDVDSPSDTAYTDSDISLIPGFAYNYSVSWVKSGQEYSLFAQGSSQANGRIRGSVTTPLSQLPIENVEVCAILEKDIEQDTAGTKYCDVTDPNGQFDIRNIYYHTEATFKVVATKENHAFDPAFYEGQLLDLDIPNLSLNFNDTTSHLVSGYVVQTLNGVSCGIGGIEIWMDDAYTNVKTDENGYYQILVEETGSYTIEPRLDGHSFMPARRELLVEKETAGVDFENTRTNFLQGEIKGGCDIFIGMGVVRVLSLDGEGCIDTMFVTRANGHYSADLPARKYLVEVVDFLPKDGLDLDPDAVLSYFETREVDLTFEGQTEDFVYRRPPEIIVRGLPQNNCSELGAAIVAQNEPYLLEIEVRESFGNANCPVEAGYVLVYDEAGDRANTPDTLELEEGKALYELVPGLPNLVAPHQKLFELVAVVDKETATWAEQLAVTGIRPREQTFTTVLPEMPLLVLHDPPGDASFSFFEEGNTFELGMRVFGQSEGSLTIKKEVKLGTRFETGPDFYSIKVEKWGTIGGALSVGARVSGNSEWIMSTTTEERFSTSNNQNITGAEGDVFVGAAMNLIYAQADILSYDPMSCSLKKEIDLVMGNNGFATTFMYTEDHVRNSLIPQLTGIRDFYLSEESDSAAIYNNQISVWKQVLENNEKNKKNAAFIENRSFSAGATYASSTTQTASQSISLEVAAFMEESIIVGAGYDISGSGVSGSVEAKLRVEVGSSVSGAALKSTTTGFELKDDDPGDFFSVNIKKDPVYGTPVFDLVSGRSSCPWEPGTQPRESLQLLSDSYIQNNIPEDGEAVFQLSLGNISQSDEGRTYILKFLQASNPDGAVVRIGGSEAQAPIPYTIAPGTQRNATITIRRGPRAFSYEGLQFVLASGCEDGAIADTVALSAHFQSAYPELSMARPLDNWLVNQENEEKLLVRFLGYDKDRLKKVQLQYAPKGTFAWTIGEEWQPAALSDATDGTVLNWNVAGFPDGAYDIRLRADYGEGDVFSSVSRGLIDRRPPAVFGLPEPADGELLSSEVISITFDEALACFDQSPQQVLFRSLTTGIVYPVELGCAERTLIIRPLWNHNAHQGENVEVQLISASDLNRNKIKDTISWRFTIGAENDPPLLDTDEDGIPDDADNCPLAANPDQRDLDGDGLGDVCDDDIDEDGLPNNEDNCPFFANPDQFDEDGNGIGDICEPTADGDGDGIPNAEDNCLFTPNSDQADFDGDGIGDVCDDDIDGDGITNDKDNCPDFPNPAQLDSNGDQKGDACENLATSTEEEKQGLSYLNIYPNPAYDHIWVEWDQEDADRWQIALVDLSGNSIAEVINVEAAGGLNRIRVAVGDLPGGMYLIRMWSGRKVLSRKVVLIK